MTIEIREARPTDAPFLALAMQEADRGHTGVGTWDIMFPGTDDERLGVLARLACTSGLSYLHYSTFLVAEVDGEPAGTVAGYVPKMMTAETFTAAIQEVLFEEAISTLAVKGAFSRDYIAVQAPSDTFRVEWVHTDPRFRRRGISSNLLDRLLDDARQDGHRTAHVGTYIGNEPAIVTYERAGFERYAEWRHNDYAAIFRAPGIVALRQSLMV